MPVRQSVVQVVQIISAHLLRHSAGSCRVASQLVEMIESPAAGTDQPGVNLLDQIQWCVTTCRPHREHERQSGPGFPFGSKVHPLMVAMAGAEHQGGIADDKHSVVRKALK